MRLGYKKSIAYAKRGDGFVDAAVHKGVCWVLGGGGVGVLFVSRSSPSLLSLSVHDDVTSCVPEAAKIIASLPTSVDWRLNGAVTPVYGLAAHVLLSFAPL